MAKRALMHVSAAALMPLHLLAGALPAGSGECELDTCAAGSLGPAQPDEEVLLQEEIEIQGLDVRLLQGRVEARRTSVEVERHERALAAGVGAGTVAGQEHLSKHNTTEEKVCFEEADCCKKWTSGTECESFCKEGTEIDKHDAKGWRLKGVCTRKWNGFCTEDEDCSAFLYCARGPTSLAGTCTQDHLCDNTTCGRGHCRTGHCTCDFGVNGEHCDRSTEAFAFLYYGNSSENLVSTRVLIQSLRSGGASQDIIAVIPNNLAHTIPQQHLDLLMEDNVKPFYSEPIYMPQSMDKDPIIHERWSGVMNKFAVWRLLEYSQVALLDTDMIFSFDSESPSQIFTECSANICAVRDGDSRFMNAGVMVITPSTQRLAHILHVLSKEHHHFAMPEQSFLTQYCKNPSNKMKLQFLDRKWNSCVGGGMMHNIGWESTGYNVLHSCSWQGKPPNMKICTPLSCNMEDQFHTVLTWQFFHMQADPCIMKTSERECSSMGINKCDWCGHYCGHSKIACDKELFHQVKGREEDEPEPSHRSETWKHRKTMGKQWPKTNISPPWYKLPRGSWAWPQVAMYQIMIDRFAARDAKFCEKLDDYCGGTLAGIRDKLSYLSDLGVDGIVMSPVVDQMPHGYHGYHTKDLNTVNPMYGTEIELRELTVLMHERQMKVIVDVNLNHAGDTTVNSTSLHDVSALKPFDKPEFYHADNCSLIHNEDYDKGAHFLERCKLYGLPDFNHENPRVWQRLQNWVREHVDKYGFDGIRVDAARHIPRSFLDHIPETGPPIPAFFEVVHDEVSYVAAYASGDYHAVYNYPLYFVLREIFVPDLKQAPMSKLADWMKVEAPKVQGRLMLNFLENNDLPRFIYKLDGDQLLYHNALVCILGMEGLPVLLYGSEQNARGILNYSDPLKVDNWRPPLWHHGYNTSTETFQLIQKVLWLRKRMNGLHEFRQYPIYSDHKVLLWSRGPALFAVTNSGQSAFAKSQRVLWDNATEEDGNAGPYAEPAWVCNLLAASPLEDCGLISPGNISRLHLAGEPKMYVPYLFIEEYDQEMKKKLEAEKPKQPQEGPKQQPPPRIVPFSDWHTIPQPPTVNVQALKRTHRSWRPADVTMTDNPNHVWHAFPTLPSQMDLWSPPVGMPATHLVSAAVDNACFYLGAQEKDGAVFVKRNNQFHVLCPDSAEWCPETIGSNVDLQRMQTLMANVTVSENSLPIVHLTYDVWYGVYHLMVGALPSVAPFLKSLQSGTMGLFFHQGQHVVAPVLSMLGVAASTFFPPTDPPLREPYHFCTQKMYFDMSTRPLYPRVEFVPHYLRGFRSAFQATQGPRPCGVKTYGIVILSRGNSSRSLGNEEELATALKTLGRSVQIVTPEPYSFFQMVDALSHAEVVVGAHGANMANIIFAPEGVKVVEIVPQVPFGLQDYHFRDLAGALNFTYLPVGQQVRSSEFNRVLASDPMTMDKAVSTYEVDVKKVTSMVASLL